MEYTEEAVQEQMRILKMNLKNLKDNKRAQDRVENQLAEQQWWDVVCLHKRRVALQAFEVRKMRLAELEGIGRMRGPKPPRPPVPSWPYPPTEIDEEEDPPTEVDEKEDPATLIEDAKDTTSVVILPLKD